MSEKITASYKIQLDSFLSSNVQFLSHAADAVFLLDIKGVIEYANNSSLNIFKSKANELISENMNYLLSEKIDFSGELRNSMLFRKKLFTKVIFNRPAEKKLSLSLGMISLIGEDGSQFGWMAIVKNNSPVFYPYFENNSPLIQCLINHQTHDACIINNFSTGEIFYVSECFQEMTGWSREELISGGIPFLCALFFSEDSTYASQVNQLCNILYFGKSEKNISGSIVISTVLRKKNSAMVKVEAEINVLHGFGKMNEKFAVSFIHERKEHLIREFKFKLHRNLPLTFREKDVAKLLSAGLSSKVIAFKLNLKENYVNNIRKRMLKKYHVSNSIELVHLLNSEGHFN
ncbi:MAG: PAS domain-containing protein [Bacteroidota bacterium]